MKRLLFVPSLAFIGVMAGCKTELLDSNGNPVRDGSGNVVMVSSSAKEKSEKAITSTRTEIRSAMDASMRSGASSPAELAEYKLPESRIKYLLGDGASQEEIDALKAVAEAEARKYREEVAYPAYIDAEKKKLDAVVNKNIGEGNFASADEALKNVKKSGVAEVDNPVLAYAAELNKNKVVPAWAQAIVSKVVPIVRECIANGQYDKAREMLWRAPTTSNADVDALVRKTTIEMMHVEVNPAQWKVVEAEIASKTAEFIEAGKSEEAFTWLKAYKRVHTYSVKLDEKLKAVEAELVKVGVDEKNMKPILDATGLMVGGAQKILDMTDVTTNAVTVIEGKELGPDLDAYKARLEEYRKTLVRYDCTETASTNIVKKFDIDVNPLLKPLYGRQDDKTVKKPFLQLGTAALNVRIDKKVAEMTAKALVAKIEKCVADGEFEKAREAFWNATSTTDAKMNAYLRKHGVESLLTLVNPANWAAIEKEFAAKVDEAKSNASYDEAIAWVEAYPSIRTYTEAIDARLDDVKESLVKLGVNGDKIQPIVEETQNATIEAARLASHIDEISKETVDKKDISLTEYEKLIDKYRTTLISNDCTDKNADELVARFKDKVAPYINALIGGTEKTSLRLGSNAVNDRLSRLRETTINTLKTLKYEHVFRELIAKTTEAVAEGKFGDARNIVRDIPLVKDAEWDAKIYATRIGLLNSLVNPNQCAALLKEIDEKAKELFDAQKYEEFEEYAKNYEYVHDTYQQIEAALEQIKAAMAGLKIADETAAEYIDRLSAKIREKMEKRGGKYMVKEDVDLTELEKALAELEKGIVAQYYDPKAVAAFRATVKKEILSLIAKTPDPMTTWELNEALRARLAMHCTKLKQLIEERDAAKAAAAYAKQLADIDAEVSFDSQVAMAGDAISKQLGVKCPEANLKVNALLGEYARTMRLLKLGNKLTTAQATAMMLGGAYLDQSAVIEKAIELGADVNGVSDRDPLRRTALLLAIQTGHNSLLKQLADAKAAFAVADADGDTALHYAVRRGSLSVVKAMLAKNDVNKANKAGETALFIAARRNQKALVSALVRAKANVALKNAKGQTAMDAACVAGSRDVLDTLADAKAEFGPAQLALAAKHDRLAVAQWLVDKGVDVNAPGVMEAARCCSSTKCYLVHEGGIPKACDCKVSSGKPCDKSCDKPCATKSCDCDKNKSDKAK